MKRKISYILTALVFTLCSCEEVLDTKPEFDITEQSYWNTAKDLELYMNGFYGNLGTYSPHSDGHSDNRVPANKSSTLFNMRTVPTSGNWNWGSVRSINTFFEHYSKATGVEEDLNHFLGEAHFFRALIYFNKVKAYGDVPWFDKVLGTGDTELLYKARDKRSFVIDKVIEDLESAIKNLKDHKSTTQGRVHKQAAQHLLARVALYEGTWMKYRQLDDKKYLEKAASVSDDLIESKLYSIAPASGTISFPDYPLYYKGIFIQEDLTGNSEAILAEVYNQELRKHNMPRYTFETQSGPSKDFVDDFLCIDGQPIAVSPLYQGDDSIPMELLNRDPRLRNIIDNIYNPIEKVGEELKTYKLTQFGNGTNTGYVSAKFRITDSLQLEANKATFDKFIFRYAETLLINAEAKAELGTITQADLDRTINKLRARLDDDKTTMAKLSLNPVKDPRSEIQGKPKYGYAISNLLYEIRRERRIELAFEGFRFDDIVRWKAGALIENPYTFVGIDLNDDIKKKYNEEFSSEVFKDAKTIDLPNAKGEMKKYIRVYTDVTERKWDDRNYLNPLSIEELTLNNKLTQNLGWE